MEVLRQLKVVIAAFCDNDTLQYLLNQYHGKYHSIIFISEGSIQIEHDTRCFLLQGSSLQFFYNGRPVPVLRAGTGSGKGFYFGVPLPVFSGGLPAGNHWLSLNRSRSFVLLALIRETKGPFQQADRLLSYCYLLLSLYSLQKDMSPAFQPVAKTLGLRFLQMAETHYKERLPIGLYARELCVSPGYLRKSIQRTYGVPPKQLLTQRLYQEAAGLLSTTDLTIKAIALELGFTEASPFSAGFKKFTGLSPSAYRIANASD